MPYFYHFVHIVNPHGPFYNQDIASVLRLTGGTVFIMKFMNLHFREWKIQNSFFVCSLITILLCIFGVGGLSSVKFSHILQNKAGVYSVEILKQINSSLDYKINEKMETSLMLAIDPAVQSALQSDYLSLSENQKTTIKNSVESLMVSHHEFNFVKSMVIYGLNHSVYSVSAGSIDPQVIHSQLLPYFERAREADGAAILVYSDSVSGVLTIIRLIKGFNTLEPLGYIVTELDLRVFKQALDSVQIDENWYVEIADDSDRLITSAGDRTVSASNIQSVYKDLGAFHKEEHGYFTHDSSASLCAYSRSDFSSLKVIAIISLKTLNAENHTVLLWICSISAVILILALFISSALSQSIIRPLKHMMLSMQQAQKGNFHMLLPVEGNYEIQTLSAAFNTMLTKISHLIKENYTAQLMQRESEIKALQAQMNPHFLYNTLETVNWMAHMHGIDSISRLICSLSTLLRASTNTQKRFIPLSEELSYIENYIHIQSVRYGERLHCKFFIDSGLANAVLPKLILQPLVENAIQHGLDPKPEGGSIYLFARRKEDTLILQVIDDGIGMEQETISNIFESDSKNTHASHIGICNTNCRLRLLYGEPYGISIQSRPGIGTTVTVSLPYTETIPVSEYPFATEEKDHD